MPKHEKPTPPAEATPTHRPISISGITFQSPNRYAEGHILTSGEAGSLNQLLSENLRNNFAGKIKKLEEAKVELDAPKLQEEFDTYAAAYTFSAGRGRSSTGLDAVTREARKLAKADFVAALTKKGIKIADYPKDDLEEKVATLVASRPKYLETAKARIALLDGLARESLDILDEAAE